MAKGAKGPRVKPRNWEISKDLMRFSKAQMFKRRGVYKKKPFQRVKVAKSTVQVITKKVGGDKNGKERKVVRPRTARALGEERKSSHVKKSKKPTPPKLRKTLTPGTVCILLAGVHKGKRVVFLKQLESGLLLVTGPLKLNNCPLRRIAQAFVIATKTRLDVSGVKIPDTVNDTYFKRANNHSRKKQATGKKDDADIFAVKKEVYKVSAQRKADQKTVDNQILGVIRKSPEKKMLFGYLGSTFAIRKNQYPHKMVF